MITLDFKSKIIPNIYISNMQQVLLHQAPEIDFNALLATSKIPAQYLDDPNILLSYQQFKALLKAALQKTQQPDLGVAYGKQLNINSYGELGLAIMSSPSGHNAILLVAKYIKMQMPLVDFQLDTTETEAVLRIKTKYLHGTLQRFILDAVVSSIHTIRGFLLNKEDLKSTVYFTYTKPTQTDIYQKTFGSQVYFDAPQSEYRFPKIELDQAFLLANPTVLKIAEEKCRQKLKDLENCLDLESTVKRMLIAKPGRFPQLTEIAEHLCMSERTLKRHLQQLDTSYQMILDDLRKELAIKYLLSTDIKVSGIAQLLNYSDPSNFGNAFKRWMNVSPNEFRQQQHR